MAKTAYGSLPYQLVTYHSDGVSDTMMSCQNIENTGYKPMPYRRNTNSPQHGGAYGRRSAPQQTPSGMYRYSSDIYNGYQQQGRKKTHRVAHVLSIILTGAAIVCGTLLAVMLGVSYLEERAYSDLSDSIEISAVQESGQGDVQPDDGFEQEKEISDESWDELDSTNPDVIGYLSVTNTEVDYPVAQSGDGKPNDYYLRHDLWGNRQDIGCPFLDVRSSVDGRNKIVYGHHVAGSSTMFSTINKRYEQSEFDSLGNAHLVIKRGGDEVYKPLCSMKVDQSYGDIQRFDFDDDADFREWLADIVGQASAKAGDADEQVEDASQVLVLVTCSSDRAGQRERTLVIFAR